MTGALESRTVQLHLNRTCNLACRHCYSRSGPTEREQLSPELACAFLRDACAEGYEVAAFSGGEPFLYPHLARVLDEARALDMRCIAVTNGTLLAGARAAALSRLDFVAISIDGPAPVHNAIRGSSTAFSRMLAGLDVVRSSGVRFGIVHAVTRESLAHLPWMAEFARSAGAEVLQLHPLGLVGAAQSNALPPLDGEMLARTYLAALALATDYEGILRIHVDLFNRERLRAAPGAVVPQPAMDGSRLADVVNPLVLMSNGDVSPICHAMGPRFRIGNIGAASLAGLLPVFRETGLARLHAFCSALLDQVLGDPDSWPYLNWYELLEQASHWPELAATGETATLEPPLSAAAG